MIAETCVHCGAERLSYMGGSHIDRYDNPKCQSDPTRRTHLEYFHLWLEGQRAMNNWTVS